MALRKIVAIATVGMMMFGLASHAGPTAAATSGVVSYGRPTVAIDSFKNASDIALGFKTHWECVTSLSDPNDPFTCTRVAGANVGDVVPQAASMQPFNPVISSCAYTGGVKIFEDSYLGGNCARFTGTGSLYLKNQVFPGSMENVGANASSMSTIGSSGSGSLLCGSGDSFPYGADHAYYNFNPHSSCENNVDWLSAQ
jgi:hypothetical protein